jgi:outer membrane protein assembly factor BamB
MGVVEAKEPQKPLRLWPGVVIVLLQWVARFGAAVLSPDFTAYGVLAGVVGGLALIVWWLFFSRAGWYERLGVLLLMIAAMAATWPFLDVSISTGAMGFLFPMLAMPGLCLAFVLWAVASRRMSVGLQRATLVAAIVLPCGAWTLIRTGGFTGSFENDLAWRWTATPEQLLLAQNNEFFDSAPDKPVDSVRGEATTPATALATPVTPENPAAAPAGKPFDATAGQPLDFARDKPATAELDWPGFRGRDRDGIVHGTRINTDWSASPPIQLWRRPIGPGWSSFAVHGDFLYTQEQRGDDEIVAAYRVSTGVPVWKHRDAARFWESNGGAGPRATPTFSGGRLYTFGATGILNALDAADGRVVWSRNVGADSHTKVPDWGFASSPLVFRDLVIGDLVIVAAAGKLVAYEAATGVPRWFGPDGGAGYSSPHLLTIHGVPQILLLDAHGATSVAPADGARLWELAVTSSALSAPIIQPTLTPDGDVLVGDGQAGGIYRIAVSQGADGWTVAERWKSTALKPLFNDFVVHKGHAFGFDGSILACIDLADGKRKWKGGRYGNGQLILLADQDLLLVVSEEGELALVAAASDKFTQLARIPAIEGKTWNHPVLAGDILLVRNGEEMAAFRLALAGR